MKMFAVSQEPGSLAAARRASLARQGYWVSSARPKRVALIEAPDQRAALEEWIRFKYPDGHAQFQGVEFVKAKRWRGDRALAAVVTLANGANVHEVRFIADEHDGRWNHTRSGAPKLVAVVR